MTFQLGCKTIGIIGFGSFGQFMAKYLAPHFEIQFYDVANFESEFKRASLDEVCKSDILILSVPVQYFEETLKKISAKIPGSTLVIDVCSVKVMPMDLMVKYFGKDTNYIGTHPLFGPKSGSNGIKGLKIAVCKGSVDTKTYSKIIEFLKNQLELNVLEVTPDEHDRQMAYVQGLTHFIAKALNDIQLPENLQLTTVTFEHLMKLKDIVSLDSEELFKIIQNGNPNSAKTRKILLDALNKINDKLEKDL